MLWMGVTDEEELSKSDPYFSALGLALLGAEELAIFRKGNVQYLPNSSSSTSIWHLTKWMIERTRFCRSAETALDDLFAYLANPEMVVHHVQPIAQVEVAGLDEPYEFPNGVMLRHSGGVPNATLAFQLTRWSYGVPAPRYHFALTKEHLYPVPIGKARLEGDREFFWSWEELQSSSQQLEDVALCLGLASDVKEGVFGGPKTIVPDTRIPFATDWGAWDLERLAAPNFMVSLAPVEVHNAARLAGYLDCLEPTDADRIRVPLRHLNLFGARLPLVEKAIHLRVALETSFLSKDNGPGLADRIALRAAIVTGSNLEERREIKQAVKKAYDLASGAVHKGSLKETESPRLTAAAEICQKALQLFLVYGGLPNDWFEIDTEGFRERKA
ncbi:hypothetical protein AYJ57_17885 [Salipiger sp. CCB-MM3]|nr:hypothetical protein AYJ57_17885 [Salipiger sp. CCB-MM3]